MNDAVGEDYTTARSGKIRLKTRKRPRDGGGIDSSSSSKRHHSHRSRHDNEDENDQHHARSRRSRHATYREPSDLQAHEAHPFRRPRASPTLDEEGIDDNIYKGGREANDDNIDPDTAFRESLFDALAEDEGAAYWEGVYGQPIHTYPRPILPTGPDGELEQMNDDEYAAYVRMRMYRKTHEHLFEEKARRDEARKRQAEEDERERERMRRREREREAWDARVADSLKRQERKEQGNMWKEAWEVYLHGWERVKVRTWEERPDGDEEEVKRRVRKLIPWPTVTGRWADVTKEDTDDFFRHAPPKPDDGDGEVELAKILKVERVRWHPDKMMHRFGGSGIDTETIKTVTAVFQVVDRMWTDLRVNKKK